MRKLMGAVLGATLLTLAATAPAHAVMQSSNVELVTKLPEAVGAIGARFSPDGKVMYVTSATGLGIYDVSTPDDPQRLSRLPLPHFENEDVDAGRDTVVITNDPSFSEFGAIYLIDVSDPAAPAIRSVLQTYTPLLGDEATQTGNGHIANCIQDCDYLYTTGTEEGLTVYDIRDLANPKFVKRIEMPHPKGGDAGGFTHDVYVDKSGLAWVTGEDGTFAFDTTDPLNPKLVMRSDEDVVNSGGGLPGDDGSGPLDFLHHNSIRTSIKASKAKRSKGRTRFAAGRDGLGDVMAVTEEDYLKPGCEGQGSLQTWQITSERNSDGSRKLKLLDLWTTETNELASASGRSPVTGNCSAHWFDESDGLLAQGWYDQGVRFLDISDPKDVRQVGFYATAGTFWAAYFAPTDPKREVVYALDTAGGIDVLRIDRSDAPAQMRTRRLSTAQANSLLRPSRFVANDRWGFACPLPPVPAAAAPEAPARTDAPSVPGLQL